MLTVNGYTILLMVKHNWGNNDVKGDDVLLMVNGYDALLMVNQIWGIDDG